MTDITNNTDNKDAKGNNQSIFGKQYKWDELYFYQKSDVIYQLSFVFCNRFIHLYKDRTRDQIIQAGLPKVTASPNVYAW